MSLQLPAGLRRVEPFTPGMNAEQVAAAFGVDPADVVKLGSGENPFGPSPAALDAITGALGGLHQYPEWTSLDLRAAVAAQEGVDPAQVICGAGETELISALIRVFAGPGDEILMHRTTFPVYHLYAEAEGRTPVYAEAGSGPVMDVDDLIAKVGDRTRVVFLTSPHNPSGRLVTPADIRRVAVAAPGALVVVDEAYIHFSAQETAVGLLPEFANMIVLRTFSKAYGLASLRVGFGIASTEIVDPLMRVKPTWNLGHAQVAGAIAALGDREHVARTTETIRANREWTAAELAGVPGLSVVEESQANFLLVRLDDPRLTATGVHHDLARRGLVVKDCSVSYLGLGDRCVRIDIAADAVMKRLVDAVREVVA
jgi:histidinol-phosphate aminotransferase